MSKAVASTAFANLTIQIVSAIAGVLIARLLGVEGRGELAAVMVIPVFLAGVGVLGADVALARWIASRRAFSSGLRFQITWLTLWLSIVAISVGASSIPISLSAHRADLVDISYFLLLSVPASICSVLCFTALLADLNFRGYNAVRLVFSFSYFGCVVFLYLFERGQVAAIAGAYIAAAFATAAWGLFYVRLVCIATGGSKGNVRSLLEDATPYSGNQILQALLLNMPILILARFPEASALGIYAVAAVSASAQAILNSSISKVVFARAGKADFSGSLWIAAVLRQSILANILCLLILALLLPPVIPVIFGREFETVSSVVGLFLVAVTFQGLSSILEQYCAAAGLAKSLFRSQLSAVAILITVGLLLVNEFTYVGVIVAVISAYTWQFAYLTYALMRRYQCGGWHMVAPRLSDGADLMRRLIHLRQ